MATVTNMFLALTIATHSLSDRAAQHLIAPLNASAFVQRVVAVSSAATRQRGPRFDNLRDVRPSAALLGQGSATIALYAGSPGHSANVAISKDGRIQCVLELERLFEIRYFGPDEVNFRDTWIKALTALRDYCPCDNGECPRKFQDGIIVGQRGDRIPFNISQLPLIVEEVFLVDRWRSVDHQQAHSSLGFYSSPFRSALGVSYDAGGNDGTFNVYLGLGLQLTRVAQLDINLGEIYNKLASLLPEVTGLPNDRPCAGAANAMTVAHRLSNAGKLMGYAATGRLNQEISSWIRKVFSSDNPESRMHLRSPPEVVRQACRSVDGQRAIAASIQAEFESLAHHLVSTLLERVGASHKIEGIVLTGGCALNVLANQLISDSLTSAGHNDTHFEADHRPLAVYVPPAPNDVGLAAGALWALDPPIKHQRLQYLGFRLWDEHTLETEAAKWGAKRLSDLGGVEYLAELLTGGPAWLNKKKRLTGKPIIAVVRGRQEFGPRALGHRSLLALPDSDDMRDRMNKLKFREWYRPVAPMIADEALQTVFNRIVKSPYMTMAPLVRDEVRARLPAIVHLDGTSRHQSVGHADEPWIHSLLQAVGKITGLAVLINTSFNSRGKPICNTVREALKMLIELPDLDYVLIEDFLFESPDVKDHAA